MPFEKVIIYPDRVEIHKGGSEVVQVKVSDVEWVKYCPDNEFKYIVYVRGLGIRLSHEVVFVGTSWIERVVEKCIEYVRPPYEAAARIALELSKHLKAISELLSRTEIQQLIEYYEQHRGCSEVYTWVTNKAGTKYYYWYLKCPHKTPSSIYLGKSPEGHRARMAAARVVAEAYYRLVKTGLRELAEELEEAASKLQLLGVAEGE